jgi:hypothetical protein
MKHSHTCKLLKIGLQIVNKVINLELRNGRLALKRHWKVCRPFVFSYKCKNALPNWVQTAFDRIFGTFERGLLQGPILQNSITA